MPARNRQRPRRPPTSQRTEDTIGFLIEASRRVFIRDGLAGMTTTSVAQEAGVAVGTVYRYFPAKEALVRAVAERMVSLGTAGLAEGLSAALALSSGRAEALVHTAITVAQTFLPEMAAWSELAPHLGAESFAAQQRMLVRAVDSLLRERPERIDVPDPNLAAFVVVTSVARTILSAAIERPESLRDGTLEIELVRLVTGYLRIRV